MTKYYYIVMPEGEIFIGSTTTEKLDSTMVEITKEKFEDLYSKLNKNTVLYFDVNNELQVRDKLSKWDEKSKTWIKDQDAINEANHQKLINEALGQLNQTDDWGLDDRCADSPDDHVKQMRDYRKQLRGIVRGTLNTNKLPELPDFMKK